MVLTTRLPAGATQGIAHIAAPLPLLWVICAVSLEALGADPVAELTAFSGEAAVVFLLLSLAARPLRRVSQWDWPLRIRRMLGLWAFAWASIHILIYVLLDLGGYWPQLADDLSKRPYIMLGALVWLLLLPLAATSTKSAMRKLGRRWKQLHRLVYLAAPLAIAHEIWQEKTGWGDAIWHAPLLAVLLVARLSVQPFWREGQGPLQKSRNR